MFQGPLLYLRWMILNWSYLDKMLIYSLEIILPIDVDDGNVVEEDWPMDDNVVGNTVDEFTAWGVLWDVAVWSPVVDACWDGVDWGCVVESMDVTVLRRVVMVVSSVELIASHTTLAASARSTSWKQKFSPGSSSFE